MATANFGEGAVFEISDDMIKSMVSFDQHLERIQKSAAKINPAPFNTLVQAVNGLKVDNVQSLERLAAAMEKLSNASGAAQGINNVAQGTQNLGNSANNTNTSLSQTAQLLNQISVSRPFQNLSIGEIKSQIEQINKMLNSQGKTYIDESGNTQQIANLDKATQQHLVNQRNALQQELKIQQASDEAKIASMKKVMDAQNADILLSEKKIAQARREYSETAKLKQQENYKKNTTVQGALDFSSTANTLQRQITAIEYLKKARLSLNTTDADYKKNLDAINQAINQHNKNLQQAGVQSANLANRHRNLMDISGQLARQFALLFSVSQIQGYIGQIAKVRGEFELQQRSLEAILQNKTEADQIFQKTVDLAIKSPFQIKELVSYTKQLAAYRIEGDKLYDTTKRLADVSAGLGVDMQRLILAYGQVKAAAYLRGTEVRQFTEAGVNMYGELQSYFQEVKGEAYTTAQIVDMISKRKVTFEDVEAVFKRLTSQGGLFYNMQEIQSETLNGKIANLKDSFDVMLNSIGKANEGALKGSVDVIRELIDNWETLANIAKTFGVILGSMGIMAWSNKIKAANDGLGLFSVGCNKAGNAFKAFGTLFKASLPTMAIFAAISAITTLIGKQLEYNKAVKDSTNKYYETKIRVSVIEDESKTDIKKALNQLVKEMNNEGYEIKIKTDISEEEAKKEFDAYLVEYDKFLNEQRVIEAKYAKNKRNSIITDDVIEDSGDYTSSVGNFIAQGEDLKTTLMQLASEENNLSAEHKNLLEELSKGPKSGEDVLSYTERIQTTLQEISRSGFLKGQGLAVIYGDNTQKILDFQKAFHDTQKDEKEMVKELENVYGSVDKYKTQAEKQRLKIHIDKSELDTVTKELAYKHYGINVDIEKEHTKAQIDWVKKEIHDSLDGTKVNIGLNFDDSFLGGLFGELDTAQKYLKNINKYKSLAKGGRTGKIYWGDVKQDTDFSKWYRETWRKNNKNVKAGRIKDKMEISDLTIDAYVGAQEKLARAELTAYNQEIEADKKNTNTRKNNAAKNERDIWSERISVLKEMQQQYEKVREHTGEDTAIKHTRSAYSEALSYTNMGAVIKPEDIVPTKQGLIDALKKVLASMPTDQKYYTKRSDLKKTIGELELEIKTDEAQKKLDEVKKQVDNLFTGLDLHQKLKDAGLSESEVQALFPGLAKTLDDVEKGINERYAKANPDGSYLDPQTKQGAAYQEEMKKLNEQRIKEQQDLVVELTKAYKTALTDQMQLDKWYITERGKIYSQVWDKEAKQWKNTLTPELQKEYEKNLNKQYDKQKSENTWKSFQQSDYYIDMFENLDAMSTTAIKGMLSRLEELRSSLKNLPADQVRAIINQMEKLRDTLSTRNPFSTFINSLKEYKEAVKNLKIVGADGELTNQSTTVSALEDSYSKNTALEASKKAQAEAASKELNILKQQYEEGVKYGSLSDTELKDLAQKITEQQKLTDELITQAELQGKITAKEAEQLRNLRNLKGQWTGSAENILNGVGQTLSQIGSELPNIASNFESIFGSMSDSGKDTLESISGALSGLGTAASGGASIISGLATSNPFQVIQGGITAFSGLTSAIGSLFGNKDKKLQRKIEQYEKQIKRLQKAYEDYHDAMNDAFTVNNLHTNYEKAQSTLDQEIKARQNQINAERDKKKSDQDQIDEWQDEIDELKKLKEELHAELLLSLGGFGDDASYKDAAQEFVDAWTDAFKEGESGLDALNETWDDFIVNVFKKTAMLKVADKIIDPFLQQIDGALENYNTTGNIAELGKKIQAITEAAKEKFPELADLLETMYGYFDINTNSTELSALQQGIEGVTESTAEALESLLNSMRFFLATQQGDVAIIRQILEAQYGNPITTTVQTSQTQTTTETSSSNPMLVELKTQTGYLQRLSDNFEGCFTYNNTSSGKGLRVYVKNL